MGVLDINNVETLIVTGQTDDNVLQEVMYCELYVNGIWTECEVPSRVEHFLSSIVCHCIISFYFNFKLDQVIN